MSLVKQLQQSIDQLREQGEGHYADHLQSLLNNHSDQADLAQLELEIKQQEERRAMGF